MQTGHTISEGGDLPEWFLHELICRVALDELLGFKSVSKQWFSFISDLRLRRLSISKSLTSPFISLSAPIPLLDHKFLPIVCPDSCRLSLPPLPPENKRQESPPTLHVIAADKGFLLIGWELIRNPQFSNIEYEYYIFNAMTSQFFSLPPPHLHNDDFFFTNASLVDSNMQIDRRDGNFCYNKALVGFTVQIDGETGHLIGYRVVAISNVMADSLYFLMFSSETGRWENIRAKSENNQLVKFRLCNKPTALNNAVYWTTIPSSGKYIVYDPYSNPKSFRIGDLPPHDAGDGSRHHHSNCCAHRGALKYVETTVNRTGMWSYFKI